MRSGYSEEQAQIRAALRDGSTGRKVTARHIILAAVLLVVVFAVLVVHSVNNRLKGPNVAAIASSSQVAALATQAATTSDQLLAQVTSGQAWLTSGPSAMTDSCSIAPLATVGSSWGPVTCARATTEYLGFSGDFTQEMQSWDTSLTAAGWSGGTMDKTIRYFNLYEGKPEPGDPSRLYTMQDLPSYTAYGDLVKGDGYRYNSRGLTISWAERPAAGAAPIPSTMGQPIRAVNSVVRQTRTVDATTALATLFATDRYVAIVTVSDVYYSQ